jgi:5-methylthioadenosine/S-adenosylhomocysteine deaminase
MNDSMEGKRDEISQDRRPDLVIEGGIVMTMVEGEAPLKGACVFVKGGRITRILESHGPFEPPAPGVEVVDATRGMILPGLVNAHSHAAMTLFRGFADDLPLKQWLFEKIFPAEAAFLHPDTVYWGALLGCAEMIASGTTCVSDGYFFQDATVRAMHDAGLRALVAQGIIDFPAPGVSDPAENVAVAEGFVEKWTGFSDRVMPGIFCHSPVTCSADKMVRAQEICRSHGVPLQIHLSETTGEVAEVLRREGMRPVSYLDKLGLVGPDLVSAHAVHLEDDEIACLRDRGAGVVHVPESNMKLASGAARVKDMAEMGVSVGLGTDGCSSNNNLDLFQEMDTAAKLSKVSSLDPIGLSAKTVLKMATAGGAQVLGWGKEIGTLEKGKRADIIVVDLHEPHLCPLYDPFSALVYSADGADVKDVVVNGKILMKDRRFTQLDTGEIMARVRRIADRIRNSGARG